jgi:eukaryotic-like serine/threonine-protein kinase
VPLSTEGTLLDARYRVLTHLGSGGMASVLLCQDERLGRLVAVKRLHADSPADVAQRFIREARVGASLNHPNLVSVYDTATDSEGVLIVMEYVEGEALAWALKRGPLRADRVARMVRDLGAALDHVHAEGVVHRDVKPGNVLLRRDGVTKLVDLGIATAADQTRITRSGLVLGTAAYMAPEQLDGGETGPATDIYALAVVAYEALTGERARPGRTPMEIAHQIATTPPPDLHESWNDAPDAAAEMLKRAMARDPADRPRSAGELSRELADALEQPQAPEEPATEPTRAVPRKAAAPAERPRSVEEASRAEAGARTTEAARAGPPAGIPPSAARPQGSSGKRPAAAIALALLLLAVATAVVIASTLSGNDGEGAQNADRQEQPNGNGNGAGKPEKAKAKPKKDKTDQRSQQAQAPAEEQPPAEEAPAEEPAPAEPTTEVDAARGAALNEQGFARMQQGDYTGAVPILQEAVAAYPEDTQDIGYAYALFNLGKSLNRSGRADEAIPYLEQRLRWADQRATVQEELDLARRNAGQG